LEECYQHAWRTQREKVTNEQYQQLWQSGWQGLLNYYYRHISTDGGQTGHFEQPFLIEQRFRARVMVNDQWITLRGQLDRLDWLDHNRATLRLVEYKTAKTIPMHNDRRSFELQLGFYQWAIEELYGYGLREMSLHYIMAGQEITYQCTTEYREKITAIAELVVESQDREDEDRAWQPEVGTHCSSCDFHRYCNAANPKAQTPPIKRRPKQLKLF
jgi:CRISPR/Cas system-associated exonuclease Cas4 (RecB family)